MRLYPNTYPILSKHLIGVRIRDSQALPNFAALLQTHMTLRSILPLFLLSLICLTVACNKSGEEKKDDPKKIASEAYNRGDSLLNAGQPQLALIHFERALTQDSIMKRLHYQIGRTYFEQDKYSEAIPYFDQEVTLYPYNVEAVELKAEAKLYLGELKPALKDINHALRMGRDKVGHAWHVKGMINYEMGNFKEAIQNHNKAIRINANTPDFYVKRAVVYGELQRYPLMVTDAEMAIKLDSTYADAHRLASFGYEKQGLRQKALEYHEKAEELDK